MEMQVDNMETNSVVEPKNKKKPFRSGYLVGILLFLIICLMGGLTYYVLKDNGVDLLSGTAKTNTTNTSSNNSESTDTACKEDSDSTDNSCDVALTNSGWSLYSIPDYDFSVEIPSYTLTQKIGGVDTTSVWSVGHRTSPANVSVYTNYLHSAYISFYPTSIPEGSGCGEGCVKEHIFNINIYTNTGSKDINDVKTTFQNQWKSLYKDGIVSVDGNITTKWGTSVWKYSSQMIGGTLNGYLVATKSFVYDITYSISDNPSASTQIAQKVLDSMKFEMASPSSSSNNVTVDVTYQGSGSSIASEYSDQVYFQGNGDSDSTSKVYFLPASKISLDSSKIGKAFKLTYDSSKTTSTGVAAGTSYLKISGTFSYVQQ